VSMRGTVVGSTVVVVVVATFVESR
jgi:hypothetical protein